MKRIVALAITALFIVPPGMAAARDQGSDAAKIEAGVKIYEGTLAKDGFRPEELCVHSIGQSHIDAAWRWRKAQTHDKVYETWGQAVGYMETHPDFMFSGSAPQYYEWILQDHPEVFAKIVEWEQKGRWEIVGGQWVEPDGNVPDGESFVRQRLVGQRFYLTNFGHISEVEWMLDSFGYHHNLPQIVARSGGKYMWTSKLTWNDTTTFPFHNFWWRSPDGSRVITHICPMVSWPMFFPFAELQKYKGTRYLLKPGAGLVADYSTPLETIKDALSDDWLNEIGVFYGKGDGGRGPTEIEVEMQEALAAKGYTHFTGGLALFTDIAKYSDRLPTWDAEMYLEYHRGVQTSQAWIKRKNRLAEQILRTAETIRSLAMVHGLAYPFEAFKELWKLMLLQQFHDILPGSSIPQVYEDARADFAKIEGAVHAIREDGLGTLAMMIKTTPPAAELMPVVVMNTLGWERGGLARVEAPAGSGYGVADQSGREVASQEVMEGGRKLVMWRAEAVPSVGYKVYYLKPGAGGAAAGGPKITDDGSALVLENELVKVRLDKRTGLLTSLLDKTSGREMLSAPSNKLLAFFDRPIQYSAWNINRFYQSFPISLGGPTEVKITAQGPLLVEAMVTHQVRQGSRLTTFEQRVRVVGGDPVVYLDLDSDFHMHYTLVKAEFNTALDSNTIAADGPYLTLEHPTHPALPGEKAQWELICQKWIDLASGGHGLALLNNGKYGYSLTADGKGYRLSLIKGARYTRPNQEAVDVTESEKNWPDRTGFTDQEHQHAELGLLAHRGDWREARLWEAGYDFNTPLEAMRTSAHAGSLPSEGSFIALDSGSVYLGSLKRAEDDNDLVLRLVEAAGKNDTAVIKFGLGMQVRSGAETDLLELNPQPIPASGREVKFELGPYQVRTLKLKVTK
ncbi:MAG TPA: glycoside hydrolase family 38 C-terminal domain-containing protein [bacterium]|nr:glycoside hydrolase family 38 C-terminal domain-containing protein [bacterium]